MESQQGTPKVVKLDDRFTLWEYVILNLLFWAFCVLQYAVVRVVTHEKLGLGFFFLSLALGFTVVSIISWCFDRFFPKEPGEEIG